MQGAWQRSSFLIWTLAGIYRDSRVVNNRGSLGFSTAPLAQQDSGISGAAHHQITSPDSNTLIILPPLLPASHSLKEDLIYCVWWSGKIHSYGSMQLFGFHQDAWSHDNFNYVSQDDWDVGLA